MYLQAEASYGDERLQKSGNTKIKQNCFKGGCNSNLRQCINWARLHVAQRNSDMKQTRMLIGNFEMAGLNADINLGVPQSFCDP